MSEEPLIQSPRGGPWTRHGHPVPGITVYGNGRPPVARCGGPHICTECAADAEHIRATDDYVPQRLADEDYA